MSARLAVQKMKDEFVSVVSHELRTPLAAIRAPLMMLAAGKGGILSERGARMTSLALESGLRLSRLIENLLDVEAMQSGTLTFAPVSCDAAAVVRTAVDEVVVVALAQRVTIETRGASANIHADPERIVVVLRNLLDNAIRFSPADSTITISIAARDDTVEFAVADQGCGIPEDKTAVIFASFEQVDSSDSRAHAGIGLGLTICRNIVRTHDGQIWVYSTPGQGSTFHFTLPRQPPSSLPTDRPPRRTKTVTRAAAEAGRLEALNSLAVLDTPREDRFDRVVRVAMRLFGVPMVGVSLIGSNRQWHKAANGLAEEGSRDDAFCNHTIRQSGALVVEDATLDDRFKNNPLVTGGPVIRFYAGQPLRSPGGHRVGALCIIDTFPRQISRAELELLRDLADWVEKELAEDSAVAHARDVRAALQTTTVPTLPGYDVAGHCVPVPQVRGHFFDHHVVSDRIHLSLADVSGHGTGAAVIAASARAHLRGHSRSAGAAETVSLTAAGLSTDLARTAGSLTLFHATLVPTSGLLTYVDAGHELVGIFEPSGMFRYLEPPGPELSSDAAATWEAQTTVLEPGETLLAISKGLLNYFDTPMEAMVTIADLVVKKTSAAELVQLVCGLSAGRQVTDQLTCLVVRRSLDAQQTAA